MLNVFGALNRSGSVQIPECVVSQLTVLPKSPAVDPTIGVKN